MFATILTRFSHGVSIISWNTIYTKNHGH